jgi:hypothetical protein
VHVHGWATQLRPSSVSIHTGLYLPQRTFEQVLIGAHVPSSFDGTPPQHLQHVHGLLTSHGKPCLQHGVGLNSSVQIHP